MDREYVLVLNYKKEILSMGRGYLLVLNYKIQIKY